LYLLDRQCHHNWFSTFQSLYLIHHCFPNFLNWSCLHYPGSDISHWISCLHAVYLPETLRYHMDQKCQTLLFKRVIFLFFRWSTKETLSWKNVYLTFEIIWKHHPNQ
jgi:hypothetical protein